MMRDTTLDQKLQAKRAFEFELAKHNVRVSACRANNGHFADLVFKDEVRQYNKRISYCGVGAHGQNGMVERNVGKINTRGRIVLLHAKSFW